MGTQSDNLARVSSVIAADILEFRAQQKDEPFRMADLVEFVNFAAASPVAPDSSSRILRALRLDGQLNYVVLNRRGSLYQFTPSVGDLM